MTKLQRAEAGALVVTILAGLIGLLTSIGLGPLPEAPTWVAWILHPVLLLLGMATGIVTWLRLREIEATRWQVANEELATQAEIDLAHREDDRVSVELLPRHQRRDHQLLLRHRRQQHRGTSAGWRMNWRIFSLLGNTHQHVVELGHETGRILELAAFGQHRLVEQYIRPVGKLLLRFFRIELFHDGMIRVDFEYRPGAR